MSISLPEFLSPLPRNIAFFSETRGGKDTAYSIIESLEYDVTRMAFGDEMKELFYLCFPNAPREPKPTEMMVQFGQSLRAIDENVFVNRVRRKIFSQQTYWDIYNNPHKSFIFTDVRQQNEYDFCKNEMNCVMVKIVSLKKNRVERMRQLGEDTSEKILNAETETTLQSFPADIVIFNDGSLWDFKKEITELIYKIKSAEVRKRR